MATLAYLVLWCVIPFLIGAAFHFVGAWLGWPALIVGGLYWIGLSITLGKD